MSVTDDTTPDPTADGTGHLGRTESAEDELMGRVRSTAKRIVARVEKALADTGADHPALPTDPTGEAPPV